MPPLTELSESVRRFTARWDRYGIETDGAYSLSVEDASSEQLFDIIGDIESLADIIDPGVLVLQIDGRNDGYRIRYNPHVPQINCERTGGEYQIESQYSHNEDIVYWLNAIESDSVADSSELRSALEQIAEEGSLELEFQYNLQKGNIVRRIEEELPTEGVTVRFHFSQEHFSTTIEGTPPHEITDYLLEVDDVKTLIVISQFGTFVEGRDIAVSGIDNLTPDAPFFDSAASWPSELEIVRSLTMIENIDSNFIPPSYFQFDTTSDEGAIENLQQLFSKFVILFSILSIVNSAEQVDSTGWRVRMSGRQYLEGVISSSGGSGLSVIFDGEERSVNDSHRLSEELYSIYEWIFRSGQAENRIVVFRNVATLFARSIDDFLSNASKILSSAKANRQYFLEQSIDDFFEFRQELMEGAFRTQRSFSELRSELMQDFTRDLFRTFGFILILSLTVFFQLDTVLPINLVFNLIAILVLVYGLITLRRIRGIRRNFNTVMENRGNFVDFYGRFLDDQELEEIGIDSSEGISWLCGLLVPTVDGHEDPQVRCGFTIDFILYYLLAGAVILGALLLLVDTNIVDIIHQIPPTSPRAQINSSAAFLNVPK